ncbi:long-chain-fatty-acid--CoA ligase [Chromobacterium violaceum]|uniref:Long-chain-fatty-acid--CoA ligase n=1 Tax=Chromobacterium violaceum (strain ATCC 12472 / DSM 30191 / JCM 1249 / CCUG 213 / NBRC 12614 / NCIMB 9131 / NCTC 9757 / MK) TaxID=243365 RepID=Q7NY16_CHRVO|nr:long-chain-fatty-acid--CoA ligase [Chromobacterium violaceum]AAQ59134.1 long chain fatty-acid CoA ligase [Chromobacterium violaceum ATCC 12472]OQS08916.1 long-chain fatty acid--CoA ligase [Chromobacterium violaceum]OQS23420.1 long-chain fatty acid--CoA ligase [Chromobacterium violaceum]SUX88706.1 Long-chain-fatty-acid--CoA ligase [Chromobacterium violaceum]
MDKVWLKNYQPGVAHEIDINQFQSVTEVFDRSVKKFSGRPAMACMDKVLSYAELDALSGRFASFLQHRLGLKKGDRVAVMMPNLLQYPIAVFGTLRAGGAVVNVNPLYTPRELEHQLKDSGAETIVILENFAGVLEQVLPRTQVKNVVVASIGEMLGILKGTLVNFVVRKVKKMVPPWRIPGHVRFSDALSIGAAKPYDKVALTHEDVAFLQYTGGTTGVAKGAVLLHKNIVANMLQASAWVGTLVREGQEVIVTALPLYHIFSLTANLMVFTEIGALNVLITNPRDIPGFVKELRKYPITCITGVNTLFNALLNHPEFSKLNFSTWRLTLGGGMAVQKAVADKWKAVTGVPLVEAYGLTETSPAACINPMDLKEYNGTIGLPVPSTEIEIRDAEGRPVAPGEQGELCIRGPQVMRGYWNRPDETAKVLGADGFLATGDMAVLTPEGYVKLVDRKKDMILVSGFNVYPNEIEDVVAGHPDVLEVACIGVPDDKSGEVVKVFVVKKNPALTDKDIIRYCRENLTGYKVPKLVEFRSELPKTNVGKILRRALRDQETAKQA